MRPTNDDAKYETGLSTKLKLHNNRFVVGNVHYNLHAFCFCSLSLLIWTENNNKKQLRKKTVKAKKKVIKKPTNERIIVAAILQFYMMVGLERWPLWWVLQFSSVQLGSSWFYSPTVSQFSFPVKIYKFINEHVQK